MTKISKCSVIYKPAGRAGEYADLAVNLFRGCDSRCAYCFAPSVLRMTKDEFHSKVVIRKDILGKLERDAKVLQARGEKRKILMCFTCDPYPHSADARKITSQAIRILKAHDLNIQILTKGGGRAMQDLHLFTPEDAFASTLTWSDFGSIQDPWMIWEPGAAPPQDRLTTMIRFHEAGIPTWASLEPVIDPVETLRIIERTHSYVDLFKVGKLNYANRLPEHLKAQVENIDWRTFGHDVVELLESLDKEYLIKDDLKNIINNHA